MFTDRGHAALGHPRCDSRGDVGIDIVGGETGGQADRFEELTRFCEDGGEANIFVAFCDAPNASAVLQEFRTLGTGLRGE